MDNILIKKKPINLEFKTFISYYNKVIVFQKSLQIS